MLSFVCVCRGKRKKEKAKERDVQSFFSKIYLVTLKKKLKNLIIPAVTDKFSEYSNFASENIFRAWWLRIIECQIFFRTSTFHTFSKEVERTFAFF